MVNFDNQLGPAVVRRGHAFLMKVSLQVCMCFDSVKI